MSDTLPLPHLELLHHLFAIDETSPSGLRWKNPRASTLKPGSIAGKRRKDGYWSVVITTDKKRNYYVHRIIFFMHTGIDPKNQEVDHVEGVLNNSLNLRKASRQQNAANTKAKNTLNSRETTSKYKGVYRQAKRKKWFAQICVNGKSKHLGSFENELEAAKAYNAAALEAWGEYALLNNI